MALIIKAAHCTARTYGRPLQALLRMEVPHAIWPGRRGGLLGGRLLAGGLGAWVSAARMRVWLGHCHLLNLRSEGPRG